MNQIPLTHQSLEELIELVNFLKEKGYKIMHGLDDIKETKNIIAVVIDREEKTLHQSNVTCMACWCNFRRYPLTIRQFFNNYERLIEKRDEEFYNRLIESNKRRRKHYAKKKKRSIT